MNLDFNFLVFILGFIFALPIIGYLFRFQIPISVFFLLAGVFMVSIFLATDGIILNTFLTESSVTEETIGNTTVYHYIVESGTTNRTIADTAGQQKGMAEGSNSAVSMLNGDSIECVDIFIAKVGNPSIAVPIIVAFYTSTNTPILEIARVNVTQVTTTFDWIEGLCVPEGQEVTIQNGIKVGITYASGDGSNFLRVKEDTVNPFDLTETTSYQVANGASSWVAVATRDLNMRMYDNEILTQENTIFTNEDNIMDFTFTGANYQIKVIMIFVAVMFMVGGALIEVKQR